MQNARTLGIVVLLALAAGLAALLLQQDGGEIAVPIGDAPSAPVRQDPTAPEAAGADVATPEAEAKQERTAAAAPVQPKADGPALVGRVVDEAGIPVAGALVSTGISSLFSPGSFTPGQADFGDANKFVGQMRERLQARETVESGADGSFRLVVGGEGNQVQIEAKARAYQPASRFVDRPKDQDVEVGDLVVKAGAAIRGRVVDNQGGAIVGASVQRLEPDGTPSGFAFPGMPGMGRGRGGPMGMFGGGNQMPGELADLMRGLMGDVLTDETGAFELANAAPGDFSLRVRHNEHPAALREGLSALPGQKLGEILIVLEPGADIRGRVTGIPADTKDVRVVAAPLPEAAAANNNNSDDPFAQMSSQLRSMVGDFAIAAERSADVLSDGSFALRGLPLGSRFRVWVVQGQRSFFNNTVCSDVVEVAAGASGLQLVYAPGVTVLAKAVDQATGQPVELMSVRHRFEGGGMRDMAGMMQNWTSRQFEERDYPNGLITLSSLRPKENQKLRLTIEAIGYRRFERGDIELPAQGQVALGPLELVPNPVVTVTVKNKRGQPIEGAEVRVRAPGGRNGMEERVRGFMAQGGRGGMGGMAGMMGGAASDRQKTDREGRAALNALPEGAFLVLVEADDYAPYRSAELIATGAGIQHAVTLLVGGIAEVTATDTQGQPIGGARVERQDPYGETSRGTTTDAGGVTFDHLTPGVHKFRISQGGNDPMQQFFGGRNARRGGGDAGGEADAQEMAWVEVEIADGQRVEVALSKSATATLTGIVRQNGEPVANARVQFVAGVADEQAAAGGDPLNGIMQQFRNRGGGRGQRTDDDGRFTLKELQAGNHRVRVTVDGRTMPFDQPVFLRLGTNEVDVDLVSATLRGVVTDPDGKPVAEASVRVTKAGDNSISLESVMQGMPFGRGNGGGRGMGGMAGMMGGGSVQTDADGNFTLEGVQTGVSLVVRAEKKGYAAGVSAAIDAAPGGAREVTVQLRKGGAVRVESAQSTPFAGVIATFEGDGKDTVPPVVGLIANGKATLEGLLPGPWRVSMRSGFGPFGGQNNGGAANDGVLVQVTEGATVDVTLQ